jgi:glycosyltransferase involved in cell wall biosynthesis
MHILVVCRAKGERISPFIQEQIDALETTGIQITCFPLRGRGVFDIIKNIAKIRQESKREKLDIIHAHYGHTGLYCLLAFTGIRVVTTFHGSDVNPLDSSNTDKMSLNRLISIVVSYFSNHSIFVNEEFIKNVRAKKNYSVIPCHVDLDTFKELSETKKEKDSNKKINILFASSFDSKIKNSVLAKKAIESIENSKLIELEGYTREQVNILLNTSQLALLTSLNEGSPQFTKEAMACGCPIVSTDVGDVRRQFGDIEGCYISSFNAKDVAEKIQWAIDYAKKKRRTKGRQHIRNLGLDSKSTAKKIKVVYEEVINKSN